MIKIALIDPEVIMRKGLALLIQSFTNYEVVIEANNGQDFIDQLRANGSQPNIVITDITMPIMDGYATVQWVKTQLPLTKIVVLTRELNDRSIVAMLKNGVNAYVNKNIDSVELSSVLDAVYNKGIYFNDLLYKNVLHTLHNNVAEEQNDYQRLVTLPEREKDFLKWLCTEKTLKQIAAEMHVSPRTIDGYRDHLFEKIKVSSRIGLVLFAIKSQLVRL